MVAVLQPPGTTVFGNGDAQRLHRGLGCIACISRGQGSEVNSIGDCFAVSGNIDRKQRNQQSQAYENRDFLHNSSLLQMFFARVCVFLSALFAGKDGLILDLNGADTVIEFIGAVSHGHLLAHR